jgi:hypothetical protein
LASLLGRWGFTALGLNPADWQSLVNGISWGPHGDSIGLGNVAGDNVQIYVKDTQGNLLHLIDTWKIWCRASDGRCFYHTIDSGIEVNLNTLETRSS